jgi:hypothetical protein
MKALIALVTSSIALGACSSPTAPKLETEASTAKAKAALVAASQAPQRPGKLAAN